jgi:uncharacterized membrane protein
MRGLLASAAVAAALVVSVAIAPAHAFGSNHKECWGGSPVYGESNSSGATTEVAGYDDCDRSMVSYRYYQNGWVYSTTYTYAHGTAYRIKPAGVAGVGGRHTAETVHPLLSNQFPFIT